MILPEKSDFQSAMPIIKPIRVCNTPQGDSRSVL